jgi:hypothetical protein
MHSFRDNLENFIRDTKDGNDSSNKARELAIMAITLHRFMEIIFSQIVKSGINNVEFLAKSELLLRSITPTFKNEKFRELLNVMESVDPKIKDSLLYYGLVSLRLICTGETEESIEVYDKDGVNYGKIEKLQLSDCSFFITFLVEKIIKLITELRKNNISRHLKSQDFMNKIDDKFDELVLETVTMISNIQQS